MKKLLFYAAALLAAISFSACSDDDQPGDTPESIVGTWQITHDEVWVDDGENSTWSTNYPDEGQYWTYTFDKSGTYVETAYDYNNVSSTTNGTYSTSSNTITLKSGYNSRTFEIKKLTGSQLVLFESFRDENTDEKYLVEVTMTYNRIK